jgi:uncharacterized cupredoxin-like copper-binding protein
MRKNRHTVGIAAASVAAALALAGAAVAALVANSSTPTARVAVTEKEYKISVKPSSLKAGKTTFVVANHGKLTHALDISGPGLKTVKVPAIAPGKSRSVTVTLGGGTFKLWCPIPGHAALGMTHSLAVKGAAAKTTTTGSAWG